MKDAGHIREPFASAAAVRPGGLPGVVSIGGSN
jgi:hypothetical protein